MSKRVVLSFGGHVPESLLQPLREEFEFIVIDDPEKDKAGFVRALERCHGIFGATTKLGAEELARAKHLEVIASVSAGYDNYDLAYLTERGILLTNTPDVLTETTADTGFAILMATARRVVELAEFVKRGDWKEKSIASSLFGVDVHGKKLGLVGFGRIGQAMARRGHLGFGMEVLYWNRSEKPAEAKAVNARFCALTELFGTADFVCVTVPLSAETEHLISAQEFAAMRPETIFINIARGAVVDEKALIAALKAGKIRGAGLDVFEKEPVSVDSPLLKMPNVVAVPHMGSATHETRLAMAKLAVKNLLAFMHGEKPFTIVNPPAWEKRIVRC